MAASVHLWRVEFGSQFQIWSTVLKVGLLVAIVGQNLVAPGRRREPSDTNSS